MIIKDAKFLTSIIDKNKLEQLSLPQFAFVGRSNVGKSSLLNALSKRKSLAKTSSTPGRTRLINIFEINNSFYFVDLPGYGFAKASKTEQASWQGLIEDYLTNSQNLKLVFVLIDSRHSPTEKDIQMLKFLYAYQIPFKIIATKIDKLTKTELQKNKKLISSELGVGVDDIIFVSSEKKQNISQILDLIEEFLN
ncbi:MAG: YihA family ribosome biogenesis GTP-binding protein [Clostridia bacterium]|nr:YihA family ribosome biogenesis GTP-binding protein [Clostridia bacterium]